MGIAGKSSTARAILLAGTGFSLLTVGDTVVKSMSDEWPITAIAMLRYVIGTIMLVTLLLWREGPSGFRCPNPLIHFARGASVSLATIFFFFSLFLMPLTEATVIQFISPMLIPLFSGFILREFAPRSTWIATLFAFLGVLIVLRPEIAKVGWPGIFPLLAAMFMSLTMVFNRMAAGTGSALLMQVLISIFATPILIAATLIGHFSGITALQISMPDWTVIPRCAIIACTAATAHSLIFMSTERAPASAIAPAVYVQVLVAVGLGWLIFDDQPDITAFAGAALVIGAGLYLWRKS